MEQHGEHGASGGAMWLAIIAHAIPGAAARWAYDICPTVVGGVGKLAAYGGDKGARILDGWCITHGCNETAARVFLFDAVGCGGNGIG